MKLLREWEGWPVGTVVSERPKTALVEIVIDASTDVTGLPERELLHDLIIVPYSALDVIGPAATHAR